MKRHRPSIRSILAASLIAAATLSSCSPATPLPVAGGTIPPTPQPAPPLQIQVLYPSDGYALEMGRSLTVLVRVQDDLGAIARDARTTIELVDPTGQTQVTLTATIGEGDVFRLGPWMIPHRSAAGTWRMRVRAEAGGSEGETSSSIAVTPSTGETLLTKYGFWLDAPSLKGIVPQLWAEKGDAQNGMIIWGGFHAAAHVLPTALVEVHWREGDFGLTSPDAVQRFVATQVGGLGFTPIRQTGVFQPVVFKGWQAWQADCRGQFVQDQVRLLVFRAPEVNKTYALLTTVVLPPPGIDPHAVLVDSFQVHPEIAAAGVAPAPLVQLLPAPVLTSPDLGEHFVGASAHIVLRWLPAGTLGPDDYYQVAIDYNHGETNTLLEYSTRQTSFDLPASLYSTPNCHAFNWQVTRMRRTGTAADGQPVGEPVSYNSLYWYVWWDYPQGQEPPFNAGCPNAQF